MTRGGRGSAAPPVLVEVTRGDRVESVHRGSVAVVTSDGTLLASAASGSQPSQRSGGGNAQGGGSIFSKGEREPAAAGAEQREGQPAGQGGGGQ